MTTSRSTARASAPGPSPLPAALVAALLLPAGAAFAQPAGPPLRTGARVEAFVDGQWQPGIVVRMGRGAEAGRVRVSLDGYTYGVSRIVAVPAGQVRRLAPAPAPARTSSTAGGSLAAGAYTCVSFLSSGATMTIGTLVVRGAGVHEWRLSDGTATPGRHTYDAATGQLAFPDGLRGFTAGASVRRAEVDRSPESGAPRVSFRYQLREGGNAFDATCTRE